MVERIDAILTWNIYMQLSEEGGTVRIYNRQWVKAHDVTFRQPGYYGFVDAVVDGCECLALAPDKGEFIMFNARNYHKVVPCSGATERVTFFVPRARQGHRHLPLLVVAVAAAGVAP